MNLSQDEINKLMSNDEDSSVQDGITNNDLSKENITDVDSSDSDEEIKQRNTENETDTEIQLTEQEIDTLGEVGNICMGAVATTMYTLLDRRVSITTPKVSVHTTEEVLKSYQVPFVLVEVEYTEGIEGQNMFLIKEPDAAMITDILLGGDGVVEDDVKLDELHMSAIDEVMNQMIGASATALSKLLGMPINISPPVSDRIAVDSNVSNKFDDSNVVIKISFDMEIENLLSSQLLQILPIQLGRDMAKQLSYVGAGGL